MKVITKPRYTIEIPAGQHHNGDFNKGISWTSNRDPNGGDDSKYAEKSPYVYILFTSVLKNKNQWLVFFGLH